MSKPSILASLTLALAAICAPAHAQSQVWTLHPGDDVQAVMTAAADGDFLVFQQGTYSGHWVLVNKSLTLVSVVPKGARLQGTNSTGFDIECSAPGHDVFVIGLTIRGHDGWQGLDAWTTDGTIRLVDTSLIGRDAEYDDGGQGATGARLTTGRFVLSQCFGRGGRGLTSDFYTWVTRGGNGVTCFSDQLVAYNSTFLGGPGGHGGFAEDDGEPGGIGLEGDLLFALGGDFDGGRGGDGADKQAAHPPGCGADGGAGYAGTIQSQVIAIDSLGGPGGASGYPGDCHGSQGSDGLPSLTASTQARLFHASYLASSGFPVGLRLEGEPGDQCFVHLSRETDFVLSTEAIGAHMVPNRPLRTLPVGTVPASGVLLTSIQLPGVDPANDAELWHLQAEFVDVQGTRILADYRPVVVMR